MARLTRCDVCECELPTGQGGYHVERLDNPLHGPMAALGYWDLCGLKCMTALATILTKRADQKGDV